MTRSALGGNKMGNRLKKLALVAGAGAVATAGALALGALSASADVPATATTVTGPATLATGHGANFVAAISPAKTTTTPVVKATGAVTFTITGRDASTVSCANTPALNGKGIATCRVAAGGLLASASAYTVTAVYAGDGGTNFGPSSGTLTVDVTAATAKVKLSFDAKPVSGSPSTFTATVTGGGGALPTGNVVFSVSASSTTKKCTGGNTEALSANSATPPQAQAVCTLPATWLKPPSKSNPHPTWTVSATYLGDGNFAPGASATKNGTVKS
ncbi:MAG: hypothetical protein ACRDY1_12765 [Acidimicrobiales bacterium]